MIPHAEHRERKQGNSQQKSGRQFLQREGVRSGQGPASLAISFLILMMSVCARGGVNGMSFNGHLIYRVFFPSMTHFTKYRLNR